MNTLILGATGGIGQAVSRAFSVSASAAVDSANNGKLILSGRDTDSGQALARELGAAFQAADVGYESHVERLLSHSPDTLDTLIYAAGAAHPQLLKTARAQETREVWNANYFGLLWTLKYALPRLKGGRLYVIGAKPELVTVRGFGQYAASKAAVARLLEITRLEVRDVRLTLVLPPAVDTPLWKQVGYAPKTPLAPDAVAHAIWTDRIGEGTDVLNVSG